MSHKKTQKLDGSSVTIGDVEVNNFITKNLEDLYSEIRILSEENDFQSNVDAIFADEAFIIDPIDGTNSYINGSSEYTINIALKRGSEITIGLIYLPDEDILYYNDDFGVYKIVNSVKTELILDDLARNRVVCTRRRDEIEKIQAKFTKATIIPVSSSVKFGLMADNKADLYVRMGSLNIWDVAAGFAIDKKIGLIIENFAGDDVVKNYFCKLDKSSAEIFEIKEFLVKKPNYDIYKILC